MSKLDEKILNWMLKGPTEFNRVGRSIEIKLLEEAFVGNYKDIFIAMNEYFLKHKEVPAINLLGTEILVDEKYPQDITDTLYDVSNAECQEGEIGWCIDKIKERYNVYLAKRLSDAINLPNPSVEEYNKTLQRISAKIERLNVATVYNEGSIADSIQERLGNYEFAVNNPNDVKGVFTGYAELDDYTYGIKESEMMVISGASSSGKSMLMLNIAINAWLGSNNPLNPYSDFVMNGRNIIYFSMEMSKSQLEQRTDANLAQIEHKALYRGTLTEDEKKKWKKVMEFQEKYPYKFYIVDMPRGSRTIDIEARYESISAEFDVDLICVDYLGIMRPNRDSNSDWLEVGAVAAELHEFCRSKNKPVITAAQRKARDRKSKSGNNDVEDLGRSKMIGDNANIVLLIGSRDEEHLMDDMEIHVVKNRDGKKGTIKLRKNFAKSRIENFPENWFGDFDEENEI